MSAFMLKRASKIIIPLIAWTFFYVFYDYAEWSKNSDLYSLINKPSFYHLWFLYAIIFMYALTPPLRVLFKNSDRKVLNYIILIWFSYASVYLLSFDVKFQVIERVQIKPVSNLETFVSLSGIYILGGYIKTFGIKIPLLRLVLVFISCMTANLILTKLTSTYVGSPNQIFFKYFSPLVVVSSCTIFLFFLGLDLNVGRKTESLVRQMSSLSFGVYLVHAALLPLAFKVISPSTDSLYSALTIPAITIAVFLLSYLTSFILYRTPGFSKCV